MRTAILALLVSSACWGIDVSGIWGFTGHRSTLASAVPVAVQIEQEGNHLRVVKLLASPGGYFLERREYVVRGNVESERAEVRSTPRGAEIRLAAGEEIWTIAGSGELTMRHKGGTQSVVLRRAGNSIQGAAHSGVELVK